MNTLIIVANQKKESFSFAIANKYLDLAITDNRSVEIIENS
jgi:putative NADPH-quinone reductase